MISYCILSQAGFRLDNCAYHMLTCRFVQSLHLVSQRPLCRYVDSLIEAEVESGIPSDHIMVGGFSQGDPTASYLILYNTSITKGLL